MAKIYNNLYDQVHHPVNLWWAFKAAARGKRYTPAVATFEYDLEKNLIEIEHDLKNETYELGGYHSFEIDKPKRRLVNAAPFRDRVVHHALMNIIEPLFERQFIFDSYANRVGKGTHAALDRCTYYLRRYAYVMHLDVRQFFPAVDHEILVSILSRAIDDERVTNLIRKIIASGNGVQARENDMVYFPNDDLFAVSRPRGLPIGNLTSQHWANVYLNEFDQYAKRVPKCRAYIRYVDDMLIFANEKEQLHQWRADIINYLQTLRLKIHEESAQPRPSHTGVSFLGFQVFSDHRRLKPTNGYAFQRRLKSMLSSLQSEDMTQIDFSNRLLSWVNHANTGDTWNLRKSIFTIYGIYGGTDG